MADREKTMCLPRANDFKIIAHELLLISASFILGVLSGFCYVFQRKIIFFTVNIVPLKIVLSIWELKICSQKTLENFKIWLKTKARQDKK